MRKSQRNQITPIKQLLAIVGEKDTTTFTLCRNVGRSIWVSTWEAGDKQYGGFAGSYLPVEFNRVIVEGRTQQALVDEAIRTVDEARK